MRFAVRNSNSRLLLSASAGAARDRLSDRPREAPDTPNVPGALSFNGFGFSSSREDVLDSREQRLQERSPVIAKFAISLARFGVHPLRLGVCGDH